MRIFFLIFLLTPPAFGILLLLRAGEQLRNFLRTTPVLGSSADLETLKSLARQQMFTSLIQAFILGLPILAFGGGILFHVLYPSDFIWILLPSVLVILAALRIRSDEKQVWSIPAENSQLEGERDRIISCWRFKAFPDF